MENLCKWYDSSLSILRMESKAIHTTLANNQRLNSFLFKLILNGLFLGLAILAKTSFEKFEFSIVLDQKRMNLLL